VYFYLFNHQNKGTALVRALQQAGWNWTAQLGRADVIFSDSDVPARAKILQSFHQRGRKVFLYPHAARPTLFNDFVGYPPCPTIDAGFVTAAGHLPIMRAVGISYPIEAMGWHFCPMKAFTPRPEHRRVLFAPIHPNSNGTLSTGDRRLNADTLRKLLPLVRSGEIQLTVRYLRDLTKNGLRIEDGVTYVQGEPDQSYDQIDQADVVISHQTFAYIAIARGVPTVMMGEDVPPRIGCEELHDFQYARSFDKYKDLLMYPYDILAVEDVCGLLQRAVRSDEEIADWRTRLIGEPFDGPRFVQFVEKYL
jgi:hypothetical protein